MVVIGVCTSMYNSGELKIQPGNLYWLKKKM